MAKKKGSGKKGAKKSQPSWMSDAVYTLSQDFPRLVEHFTGSAQSPSIDSNLAGILIWQKVYPSDKKASEIRDEAIKLGVIESAVKILSLENTLPKTPAAGVLATLLEKQNARDIFCGLRSQPMSILLDCLSTGNPCLSGYTCRVIARLASAPDSKLTVMKGMQDWDWKPLVKILKLQETTTMLGGDYAAADAALIMSSICDETTIPENTAPNSYRELCGKCKSTLIKAGAVEILTNICIGKCPNWCKIPVAEALRVLMKGSADSDARRAFVMHGGPEAIVEMLKNSFFSLKAKATIVECLCISLLPIPSNKSEQPSPEIYSESTKPYHDSGQCVDNNERRYQEETYYSLNKLGVIPLLLNLCLGPDGPLSERTEEISSKPSSGTKKKGKGSKKKKPAKLEPGMAEAQSYATGCLRLMSTDENVQTEIMLQGGVRYLTPLLSSKVQQARWNAREILMNLATVSKNVEEMSKYQIPSYITQSSLFCAMQSHR